MPVDPRFLARIKQLAPQLVGESEDIIAANLAAMVRDAWDVAADASKSALSREWSVQMVQGIWHAIAVLEEFEERSEEDGGPFLPKEFHDLRYHLLGTITCPKSGKAIPQVMRDMGIDVDADDEDD